MVTLHPSPWIPGSDIPEITPNQESLHGTPLTKIQAKAFGTSFSRPISPKEEERGRGLPSPQGLGWSSALAQSVCLRCGPEW